MRYLITMTSPAKRKMMMAHELVQRERETRDVQCRNALHHEQVVYLLDQMRGIKEGDATLLDNSMIVYGLV